MLTVSVAEGSLKVWGFFFSAAHSVKQDLLRRNCLHFCKGVSFDLHKASKVSPESDMKIPGHDRTSAALMVAVAGIKSLKGERSAPNVQTLHVTLTPFSCLSVMAARSTGYRSCIATL